MDPKNLFVTREIMTKDAIGQLYFIKNVVAS